MKCLKVTLQQTSPNENSKYQTQLLLTGPTEDKLNILELEGHRRYNVNKFLEQQEGVKRDSEPELARKCVCYARVSSSSQKEDLERQAEFLRNKYPDYEIITDIGSGLNFKRKGFKTILGYALRGELQELVVTYKDRLLRFGFELFREIVQHSNGKIVVLRDSTGQTPEQELSEDLVSIITVFTARVHGFRSHKNKSNGSIGKNSQTWEETVRRCKDLTDTSVPSRKGKLDTGNTPAE